MQYQSSMPINREDAPAGALFQHLRDNGLLHALHIAEYVFCTFSSSRRILIVLRIEKLTRTTPSLHLIPITVLRMQKWMDHG